jgi:hypothetical protein
VPVPEAGVVQGVAARGGHLRGAVVAATRYAWNLKVFGCLALGAVLVLGVPGNGLFDINPRGRRQLLGTVLSHGGVLALLLGFYPDRERWLAAVLRRRGRDVVLAALGAAAALLAGYVALLRAWPAYGIALGRESGLLEPMQVGTYLVAAWLAVRAARLRGEVPAEARLFRLAAVACVTLALEEIEYFGLVQFAVGRVRGVWIRSLHDLVALAARVPGVWVGLGLALVVLVVLAWAAGWLSWRVVAREGGRVTTLPLWGGLALLAISQVLDVDAGALARYGAHFQYRLEEAIELVAALLIALAFLLKVRHGDLRRPSDRAE